MRALHKGWAFLALLAALAAPGALAANYPVGQLTFASGQIPFASSELRFNASALTFPTSFLATETATTVEVTLPADILFDFDKADVRPQAQSALQELAHMLREKARGPVAIRGYTDALGKDAYNQKLSERRAAAIKTWLTSRESLTAMNFTTAGFGARDPVAANKNPDGTDNPDGRQLNRRVTIIIRK